MVLLAFTGPWHSAGALTVAASPKPPPVAGISNPTPYIFANGTVIMLGRGPDENHKTHVRNHNIFLYRAPSWNSTYVPKQKINLLTQDVLENTDTPY